MPLDSDAWQAKWMWVAAGVNPAAILEGAPQGL